MLSNNKYLSNSAQRFAPVTGLLSESTLTALYQTQNCSMVTLLDAPRVQALPANPLAVYLHANRTCKKQYWSSQDVLSVLNP